MHARTPFTGVVYKYRSFQPPSNVTADEHFCRIRQMLLESKVWFSDPTTLNDLHECNPALIVNPEETRKYALKKLRTRGVKPKKGQVSRYMSEHAAKYDGEFFRKLNGIGIYSMSESAVLHSQWAYYADEHRGFALRIKIDENFMFPCYKVEYSECRAEIIYPKFLIDVEYSSEAHLALLLRKSRDWEKEREVRAINIDRGLVNLPQGAITGVIFGVRCESKHKEFIAKIVAENSLEIDLLECRLQRNTFDFDIVPMQL